MKHTYHPRSDAMSDRQFVISLFLIFLLFLVTSILAPDGPVNTDYPTPSVELLK